MLFVNLNFELKRNDFDTFERFHWLTYTLKPSIPKPEEWEDNQTPMEF